MYPAMKELFLETAEEDGWLDEWGKKRDIEKLKTVAKRMLLLGRPVAEVVEVTELPPETVRGLM